MRALAAELGVGVGTVGGWLSEYHPRPQAARRLADYFGVSVEDLLDDKRELPVSNSATNTPVPQAADAAAQYGAEAMPTGQAAFEAYLGQIRAMRTEAERLAGGDRVRATDLFDHMLATWRAALEPPTPAQPARGKKLAKAPKFLPVTLPSQTQALSAETGKPLPSPLRRARPA